MHVSNPKFSNLTYTYEPAFIEDNYKNITILNDSINKATIRPRHDQDYMLICDKIFETKGRYYIGACALVEKKALILIKMMSRRKI